MLFISLRPFKHNWVKHVGGIRSRHACVRLQRWSPLEPLTSPRNYISLFLFFLLVVTSYFTRERQNILAFVRRIFSHCAQSTTAGNALTYRNAIQSIVNREKESLPSHSRMTVSSEPREPRAFLDPCLPRHTVHLGVEHGSSETWKKTRESQIAEKLYFFCC